MLGARYSRYILPAVLLVLAGTLVLDHLEIGGYSFPSPPPRKERSLYAQYIEKLLETGEETGVKLKFFHPDILEDWSRIGTSLQSGECLLLCGRMLIFAVDAEDLKAKPAFLSRLGSLGFNRTIYETDGQQVHVSLSPRGTQHVHIVVLHARDAGYLRQYALTEPPRHMDHGAREFLSMDRAFDRLETTAVHVEGMRVQMPVNIPAFLADVRGSQFLPCNMTRAKEYYRTLNKEETKKDLNFKGNAMKLLAKSAKVLDQMKIPFWIASGTFLGYFRQCDIIPWSYDVDIAMFVGDFRPDLPKALVANGLTFIQIFGRLNDSYELSFKAHGVKLDIFFFYQDGNTLWHGGINPSNGQKYRYNFPSITLCWGELVGLKVRVPCQGDAYVTADYGPDWFTPKTVWSWMKTPNMVLNGFWDKKDWPEVNVVKGSGIKPK